MSELIEAKLAELRQHQAVNAVRVAQVQAAQEAMAEQPAPYALFTSIVKQAADSAERSDIAAQMIEADWFSGDEWLGGEFSTMQVWEATLRFVEQAMTNGYERIDGYWCKGDSRLSQAAVVRKVGEMVQR